MDVISEMIKQVSENDFLPNSFLAVIYNDDIILKKTCESHPEQYDAFLFGKKVGYLRLRHGHFSVTCPDVEGQLVYDANTQGDGEFEYEERSLFLQTAKESIINFLFPQSF